MNTGKHGRLKDVDLMKHFDLIECWSRSFNKYQINYHIAEKELASVIWSCEKYRYLLLHAKNNYILTDHDNILRFIEKARRSVSELPSKFIRWINKLSEYELTIYHINGVRNYLADFLVDILIIKLKLNIYYLYVLVQCMKKI